MFQQHIYVHVSPTNSHRKKPKRPQEPSKIFTCLILDTVVTRCQVLVKPNAMGTAGDPVGEAGRGQGYLSDQRSVVSGR